MKINKQGITFKYRGDDLTWIWWWNRTNGFKYDSATYQKHFESIPNYLIYTGQQTIPFSPSNEKLKGLNYQELIEQWAYYELKFGFNVVLFDIVLQAKPASYWNALGLSDRSKFLQDIVILNCKSIKEVIEICDSIDINFARAIGVNCGNIIYRNEDYKTPWDHIYDYPPLKRLS